MKQLTGIHHVSAITSSAEKTYDFFTNILGMRLVKKTVNQDDIKTYHLFFADDKGNAGTDMTFFDFPGIPKGRHGTNEIYRTAFRVPTDAAIEYWEKRFTRLSVSFTSEVQFGKRVINFYDFDHQQYQLISDENNSGVASGTPWVNGPIPLEFAITGLGPITIRVSEMEAIRKLFDQVFFFRETTNENNRFLFEMGEGGNGAQVILELTDASIPSGLQGAGTIHHVAFRVDDQKMLLDWNDHLQHLGLNTSGYVDRFFFESIYTRLARNILFELATDGPGFMGDEEYETLGEKLSLPPFLENKREYIESVVRPINTVRSTKVFEKEWEDLSK